MCNLRIRVRIKPHLWLTRCARRVQLKSVALTDIGHPGDPAQLRNILILGRTGNRPHRIKLVLHLQASLCQLVGDFVEIGAWMDRNDEISHQHTPCQEAAP